MPHSWGVFPVNFVKNDSSKIYSASPSTSIHLGDKTNSRMLLSGALMKNSATSFGSSYNVDGLEVEFETM